MSLLMDRLCGITVPHDRMRSKGFIQPEEASTKRTLSSSVKYCVTKNLRVLIISKYSTSKTTYFYIQVIVHETRQQIGGIELSPPLGMGEMTGVRCCGGMLAKSCP